MEILFFLESIREVLKEQSTLEILKPNSFDYYLGYLTRFYLKGNLFELLR